MPLFQATNIFPSHTIGRGGDVVDAAFSFASSWQLNGNSPLIAYRYRIMENTVAGTQVYDSGKIILPSPIHPVDFQGRQQFFTAEPVPENTLINGYANGYKSEITQWWSSNDADKIVQTSPSFFITRSTPSLTITPFETPLNTRSHEFTAIYEQAENTPLAWFRWLLANDEEHSNIIHDSGNVPNSADIRFIYDRLFTDTHYAVKISGETQDGVSIDTEWVDFEVEYPFERITNVLKVCKATDKSAVRLDWGKLGVINARPENDDYAYLNNLPVTDHNSVQIEQGNSFTFDEITGQPMQLPPQLNYVWSGAFEQNDYKPLQIIGIDDEGNESELALHYQEGPLKGILCEIEIEKSDIMPNIPLIFGEPTNKNWRFLENVPDSELSSIKIDAGNEVVFDKSNNRPLFFDSGLSYAWSGKLPIMPASRNKTTFLEIGGINATGQATRLETTYEYGQAQGILCETIANDTIYAGYSVLPIRGIPANINYSFADGAIEIGADNIITFGKEAPGLFPSMNLFPSPNLFPSRPMPGVNFNAGSAFVWSGEPLGDTVTLFSITAKMVNGEETFLRAEYDGGISIYLGSEVLCSFPGLSGKMIVIIERDTAYVGWDGGVESATYSPMQITAFREQRLFGRQICDFIYSKNGPLSDTEREDILQHHVPVFDHLTTNMLCLFNGEAYMKYAQVNIVLNGKVQCTYANAIRSETAMPPDIYADDWLKLLITPTYAMFGRIRPDRTTEYYQLDYADYANISAEIGNTISTKLRGSQLCNYIWLLKGNMPSSIALKHMTDLSYEPVLDEETALLCLFNEETDIDLGTISLLNNGVNAFNLNILRPHSDKPPDDPPDEPLVADGWWTVTITPDMVYANWFYWDIDNKEAWQHRVSVQTALGLTFDDYTRAVILNGRQKCNYLWLSEGILTTSEIANINTNLAFEPEWSTGTQLLALFNNNLSAGSVFNEFDVIQAVDIYRLNVADNLLEFVGRKSLQEQQILDYAAKSREEYQYYLFPVGNKTFGQPVFSNVITPYFWDYALLDCAETENGEFDVIREYRFGLNLESGAMQNNAKVEKHENFTAYPKYMISPQNYISGSFTSLIGYIDYQLNKYVDTQDMAQAIFDLTTNGRTKFVKDRAGGLWRVILLPISIKTADATFEQQKAATITWESCGSADGLQITGKIEPEIIKRYRLYDADGYALLDSEGYSLYVRG